MVVTVTVTKDDPGKSPWDHTGLGYPTFPVTVKVVRPGEFAAKSGEKLKLKVGY